MSSYKPAKCVFLFVVGCYVFVVRLRSCVYKPIAWLSLSCWGPLAPRQLLKASVHCSQDGFLAFVLPAKQIGQYSFYRAASAIQWVMLAGLMKLGVQHHQGWGGHKFHISGLNELLERSLANIPIFYFANPCFLQTFIYKPFLHDHNVTGFHVLMQERKTGNFPTLRPLAEWSNFSVCWKSFSNLSPNCMIYAKIPFTSCLT